MFYNVLDGENDGSLAAVLVDTFDHSPLKWFYITTWPLYFKENCTAAIYKEKIRDPAIRFFCEFIDDGVRISFFKIAYDRALYLSL